MSERAAPFYCPYCGDEDLEPTVGGDHTAGAAWRCRSCARVFALKFLGLSSGLSGGHAAGPSSGLGNPSHDDA